MPRSAVTAIQEALYRMDRNALQKALETFLLQTISFHDAANEVFYHGLILGMCAVMDHRYRLTSNRESGDGRFDIQMLPLSKKLPGILIELKTDKNCSEKQLEALSKIVLKQINDRTYSAELSAMGVSTILKYGIAFSGKKARITVETETI